jgi:hypothetical protein
MALILKSTFFLSGLLRLILSHIKNPVALSIFFDNYTKKTVCHHSLPSIITPIKNKQTFRYVFFLVYVFVLGFFLLLSYTGLFAFGEHLNDFYTLNFEPKHHGNSDSLLLTIIEYYLSLFPVFTISASFPIIAITLRNNLISLFKLVKYGSLNYKRNMMMAQSTVQQNSKFIFYVFPIVTLVPPLIVALITLDLQLLVGITGKPK